MVGLLQWGARMALPVVWRIHRELLVVVHGSSEVDFVEPFLPTNKRLGCGRHAVYISLSRLNMFLVPKPSVNAWLCRIER